MEALDVRALIQVGGNLFPVLGSKLPDEPGQSEVLLVVPVPFCVLSLLALDLILIRLKSLIICIIVGVRKIIYVGLVLTARQLILVADLLWLLVLVALSLGLPVVESVPGGFGVCCWVTPGVRTGHRGGDLGAQGWGLLDQM